MRMQDLVIASIDDHIVEPPDLFEGHLPKDLEQPRIVENQAGHEPWRWDDLVSINIGLNAVVGRPSDEWGMERAGGREPCTVAALRKLGEGVDTTPVSLAGVAPSGYERGKVVTSQDVLGALQRPGM